MMRKKYKSKKQKFVILLFTCFFMFYLAIPALAETIEDLKAQNAQSQNQIAVENDVIKTETKKVNEIEQQIVQSNQKLQTLQQEATALNNQITALNNQIAETQKKLDKLLEEQKQQQEQLNERIRVSYMYGTEGYAEALFSEDDFTQQLENTELLGEILKYDQDLLEKITKSKEAVEQVKKELDSKKKELDEKKALADEKVSQQEQIKQDQQKLLNDNQAIIAQAKKEIQAYEASISQANQKINQIVKEADDKAKNERIDKVEGVYEKASALGSDVNVLVDDTATYFGGSTNESINNYLGELNQNLDQVNNSVARIKEILDNTKISENAAVAVNASKQLDSEYALLLENTANLKTTNSKLREVDLARKKQEAIEAAERAKNERDAAIKKEQEEAAARADQAAKEAEEASKKASEEAQKAQQEAGQQEEEVANQAPPAPAVSDWESGYISSSGWRWPLDGIFDITSVFGYRIHPIFGTGTGHEGIDIGASTGTPIHSCDGGTVILAGENGGYGNCVIVQQDSGHQVYYGHQSEIACSYGQRVEKGDVIGYVGSTGWSTGPHLHLGVLTGDGFVDPFTFFPEVENMI